MTVVPGSGLYYEELLPVADELQQAEGVVLREEGPVREPAPKRIFARIFTRPAEVKLRLSDISITVSRAAARASRALSRRFGGYIASPAPLRVHRPTRASGDGAEGFERIEVRESLSGLTDPRPDRR